MENDQEARPHGDGGFLSEKRNIKTEEGDDGPVLHCSSERRDFKVERGGRRAADSGDEQAAVGEASGGCAPPRGCIPADHEEDYGVLFSQYSSTLYDVAMEAVTQSLLAARSAGSRKKSPAWKHFVISPRDSTKAVCVYCMKEFSRGKNEKDLSTSCLMRHVRRAHPAALVREDGGAPALAPLPAPALPSPTQPARAGDAGAALPPVQLVQKTASRVPSPDWAAEESVSAESSKEAPVSDRPVSEKCPGGAPHCDDAADSGPDRSLPLPKGTSGSRRWSAVWKHFYLSPLDSSKAVCVHCMHEFSRGKNGKDLGTSCLIRHMWRAHRAIVLQEKSGGAGVPPPYPAAPTLLPAPPPPEGELRAVSSSPGKLAKEPFLPSSSPDRLTEDRPARVSPGDAPREDPSALSSSDEVGEAAFACSPEKQQGAGPDPPPSEPGAVSQQNKRVTKRLKSEVWHHFSLAPTDSLKAVCRHCGCVISRGKKGDVGTSCLMRHLYRRHPEVVGSQKGFLGDGLAPSSYGTLASAESSSPRLADTAAAAAPGNSPALAPAHSKKTSKLWNHFSAGPADPTKVVCLHCGRTISRGKKPTNLGTSCLLRHLQRFHGSVLAADAPKATLPPAPGVRVPPRAELSGAASFGDTDGKLYDSHPVAKKITSLVAEMIALDLQPYSVVDNVGFSRLLAYLKPQYSLPSPSYFSRTAIPGMYEDVKRIIRAHLQEAESGVVHFTSGIWTSPQPREYLTLTAHWVTFASPARPHAEDHHCSALLHVAQVDCDCSGSSVQRQLECWWEAWVTSTGLQVGITVTDSPSIGRTLSEAERSSVHCFSHTVGLVVGEAVKSQRMVQNLLSIARKVCERVLRSHRARERLAELQRELGLPPHPLLQDVPARWSTSLRMLERLVEQKRAVDGMSAECGFRELISSDQWEVMQSVCHALKPFDAASREMSGRVSTLGQVIPMIHILNRKVEMLFEETMGIDTMLKSLKDAMASRLSATLHDPRYVFATLLDPRYKASLFSEEEAEQYKQDLVRELEMLNSTSEDAPVSNGCEPGSPPRASGGVESLWSLMAQVTQKGPRERAKVPEAMVLAYLEEEVLEHSCDPLAYWSLKRAAWPGLAALAVRFLGCPPSVVPSERLFSTPTENGSFGQSRLLMEHFEKLVFLKVNLPLIYFQY